MLTLNDFVKLHTFAASISDTRGTYQTRVQSIMRKGWGPSGDNRTFEISAEMVKDLEKLALDAVSLCMLNELDFWGTAYTDFMDCINTMIRKGESLVETDRIIKAKEQAAIDTMEKARKASEEHAYHMEQMKALWEKLTRAPSNSSPLYFTETDASYAKAINTAIERQPQPLNQDLVAMHAMLEPLIVDEELDIQRAEGVVADTAERIQMGEFKTVAASVTPQPPVKIVSPSAIAEVMKEIVMTALMWILAGFKSVFESKDCDDSDDALLFAKDTHPKDVRHEQELVK